VAECAAFIRNPERFKLVSRIEIYEVITEVPVILMLDFHGINDT